MRSPIAPSSRILAIVELGLFAFIIHWGLVVSADTIVSNWNFNNETNRLERTGSDVSGTAWSGLTDGSAVASSGKTASDYISWDYDPILDSTVARFSENNVLNTGGRCSAGEFSGNRKDERRYY